MKLTPDEKIQIISNIETGQYSSQAALDNIERIVHDLVGVQISGPRFNAKDLQVLYNLIKTLENKADDYSYIIQELGGYEDKRHSNER